MTVARLILRGEESLERCLRAAAADPHAAALFCDIDGTISPIARTPSEAVVPAETRSVLARLVERLGLVAIVTGRDLDGGRRMVDLPGAAFVGTHGLELMDAAGERYADPAADPWVPAVREMIALARQLPLETLGILIEDKGSVFDLHYRTAPDREAARAAILQGVLKPARARGLGIMMGHLVFEVRPPVAATKGTAALRLLAGADYAAALFLGDDLTDCNGFDAIHAWAHEAAVPSRAGLAVAALTEETWEEVKAASDVWVAATPGIFEVLTRLLRAVSG